MSVHTPRHLEPDVNPFHSPYSFRPIQAAIEDAAGFSRAFTREISRVQRGASVGGVLVLIDFDNYSDIVMHYGAAAAEDCAKLIGGILTGEIRPMDAAGRLNRESFALLLADTSVIRAVRRVQSLALGLNNLSLIRQLREIQINVSLSMKPYDPDNIPEFFKHGGASVPNHPQASAQL